MKPGDTIMVDGMPHVYASNIVNIEDFKDLKSDFTEQWNKNGAYLAQNLYGELLSWNEILDILNKAIRTEQPELNLENHINNNFEIPYKDLVAMKKVSDWKNENGKVKIESDATFFFSIFFNSSTFSLMIPELVRNKINTISEKLNIFPNIVSLKIALSDKFVPYEHHSKNTIIIQLQGTNTWNLRDIETKKTLSYSLEPGDCLLFKSNMEHSLTNDNPRSSMVGTFRIGKEL